jgi:phenylacetate-CoA ligase
MWNWRRAGFFALDHLRGRRFQSHLDDLTAYFADPDAYEAEAEVRLRQFLEHATNTTAAFGPYSGSTSLRDFPIMTKQQIALRRREFVSTRFNHQKLPTTTTSGSYGTPFSFPLTRDKWVRQRAEIIFFGRWAGFEIGDRHGYGLMGGKAKSRLTRFVQNEVWFDPLVLSDERLAEQCERLRREHVVACIVNPSHIRVLAMRSLALGIPPSRYDLRGIIATAEMVDERTRRLTENAFGCQSLGRYSAAELGVLAQECALKQTYHLNRSSYTIELLAIDRDEPVMVGEIGRVVVTDAHSHAMPLIRYETGDLAIEGQQCACGVPGSTLSRVIGRSFDTVYDSRGRAIYPVALNVALTDINHLVQYQFVQRGDGDYVVRLRAIAEFSSEVTVMHRLRAILGSDACIEIEYVDDIPPLPSGKRPVVVNEWARVPQA